MVNKELLSEVLGFDIARLRSAGGFVMYLPTANLFSNTELGINIYELAHKCKEWAYTTQNIVDIECIDSKRMNDNGIVSTYKYWVDLGYFIGEWKVRHEIFMDDTEPEAIFKACEWILKKEGK